MKKLYNRALALGIFKLINKTSNDTQIAKAMYRAIAIDFALLEERVLQTCQGDIPTHEEVAAELFNVTIAEVTTEQRRVVKTARFLALYQK